MDPIRWLEGNADGFAALDQAERDAPMHFSLLWSHFEAEALHTYGSPDTVVAWVRSLSQSGRLDPAAFNDAVVYFKGRYFHGGEFTANFTSLRFPDNDKRDLVEAVLSGRNHDPVDAIVVLLLIIYRFRNNYFHGPKWAYKLHDQRMNFTLANQSLMRILDMSHR